MKQVNKILQTMEKVFKAEKEVSPDEKMNLEEMITTKGFPFESHEVTTSDGYILQFFRIPGGKNEVDYSTKLKQPVFFQHGLLDSADGWVCNEESRCLPYIMANNGYDVWLGNSRGNKYCKKHLKYSPKDFEFWQFSLHEMGNYDLPAELTYIKEVNLTHQPIVYFGHSQGTAMLFAALTSQAEFFRQHVKVFIALAPVARLSNMSSTLLKLVQNSSIHKVFKATNVNEMFPADEQSAEFNSFMNKHFSSLSNWGVSLISDGESSIANDPKQLGVYMKHFPCGTSLKTLNHFIQIFKSKIFTMFDYKADANMFIYKQMKPPEYPVHKIQGVPIMLVGGMEDKLATPDDVKWLYEQISKNVIYYKIEPEMGHIAFLIGKSISWFDGVLDIINKQFNQADSVPPSVANNYPNNI